MKLMMTKSDRHARAAEHFRKGGDGHITLTECDLCGNIEWVSTATKEPNGFTVVPLSHQCQRCEEVLRRAPEVANWVFSVIAKSQEDSAPNIELRERAL